MTIVNTKVNTKVSTLTKVQQGSKLNALIHAYISRVTGDSGTVDKTLVVRQAYDKLPAQSSIVFAWMGGAGSKKRTSTIYKFFTKLYSLFGTNDATQTTENSQPYESGNIAPNEVQCLKEPDGTTKLMTHPDIVVSGTYTITRVEEKTDSGKTVVTHTEVTTGTLNSIDVSGRLYAYIIRNIALTEAQKAAEESLMLSIYPEIPSVTIGPQTWATSNLEMVATPMGNAIANVTGAANVEKITTTADRDFSSDTGWWTKGTGWTIGSGVASSDGTQTDVSNLSRAAAITTAKWHKVVFTVSGRTAGTIKPLLGTATITAIAADGTYTYYIKSVGTSIIFQADADFVGSIDNVSCGEVGWADSQELYDGLIAQGYSEADAVKEAAMWSYYNNNPDIGAIYGKLYNWYAAKLLQNDIDAYNALYPTTPWGWHVPSFAEIIALQTALGGGSVAGGKMKVVGTDYWNSSNTGADNSSGFSALGSGYRNQIGVSVHLKNYGSLISLDMYFRCEASSQILQGFTTVKTHGASLRLIKD